MKSVYTSRTFWVNVIAGILAVLALPEIGMLPPEWIGYLAPVTAVLNVILRVLTTEPVSLKTPSQIPVLFLALALAAPFGATACVSTSARSEVFRAPEAQAAWRNLEIVRGLDLLRDIAIEANKQEPPMLSEGTTRLVVQFHVSALTALKASENGWQGIVLQALDDLAKDVPNKERPLLGPYLGLAKTVLNKRGGA